MDRVNVQERAPAAYAAMFGLERYLQTVDLPQRLVELLRIRTSQINGCAYCIALHSQAARKAGEGDDRLLALAAWRESPLFEDEERAALALADAATLLSGQGVSDRVYDALAVHFSDEQTAQLVMVIAVTNAWNRIAVTTHAR